MGTGHGEEREKGDSKPEAHRSTQLESERPGVRGCDEFVGDVLGGRRRVLEAAVVSEAATLELRG